MSAYRYSEAFGPLDWGLDENTALPEDTYDGFVKPPYSQFKFDSYNWNDPAFLQANLGQFAYRVIPLTQGYFMIVSPHDYERMIKFADGSPKKWCVCIRTSPETGAIIKIYAKRRGRGNEPKNVYAHREVIDCIEDPRVVDHMNGLGLDNRRGTQKNPVNLRYTGRGENGHNTVRERSKHIALPRGVELRGKNKIGLQRYGGMFCKRIGKKVRTIRSKKRWLTPEPAARWYQNRMKNLHQRRTAWAHSPESVCYPIFPPYARGYVPF